MSRDFEVIRDVDLPASPEEVWVALTADSASWMFPTGMEIPAGATPPEGVPVTTWEPPHHFVVRMEAPDGTYNSLEYLITAHDGGTAHLHYVHSGILADEWEDQYDAIGAHTDFYLHTLSQYLQHFQGKQVTYVGQPSSGIDGPSTAGGEDAMQVLRAALGIDGLGSVGDPVSAPLGTGKVEGVIDYSTPEFLGVRTDDTLFRFFGRNFFGGVVGMSAHVFREGVDPAAEEASLKEWLDSLYA
jgi:hypothetical protein